MDESLTKVGANIRFPSCVILWVIRSDESEKALPRSGQT